MHASLAKDLTPSDPEIPSKPFIPGSFDGTSSSLSAHQESINKPLEHRQLLLSLTAHIVASYGRAHALKTPDITAFIQEIYKTLEGLYMSSSHTLEVLRTPVKPAVPIEQSVLPDAIFCLEDGKPLKMLKRYLKRRYNMTPEQYRERWNLPPNYPMAAPNYAKARSALAVANGLGKKRT